MDVAELLNLRAAENEHSEKDETIKFLREKVLMSEEKINKALLVLKDVYECRGGDEVVNKLIKELEK